MLVINAENLIIGRLATYVAKKVLEGEKVIVVNSEKAVVTGKKEDILRRYKQRADRGDAIKGPFFPKTSDRIPAGNIVKLETRLWIVLIKPNINRETAKLLTT